MVTAIHVPRVNNNDDEVRLVEWKVEVGAPVTRGQVLGSVETDKAVVEIEAPVAGTVARLLESEGTVVKMGQTIAIVAPG